MSAPGPLMPSRLPSNCISGAMMSSQSALLYDGEVCLGGGVIGAARGKGLAD